MLDHSRVTSWDPAGTGVPLEALVAADTALRHPHLVTTHAWTLVTQPVSPKQGDRASKPTACTTLRVQCVFTLIGAVTAPINTWSTAGCLAKLHGMCCTC